VTESIAVFIDFQNVHLVGHGLHGGGSEPFRCVPDPIRLADLIASKRRRPSTAKTIRVYRGRPDPNHQPKPAASNDAQTAQWTLIRVWRSSGGSSTTATGRTGHRKRRASTYSLPST
jgi:hypothetical protein